MLAAIDAKDIMRISDAGAKLDEACEGCHLIYWYPNEGKGASWRSAKPEEVTIPSSHEAVYLRELRPGLQVQADSRGQDSPLSEDEADAADGVSGRYESI